MLIGVRAEQFDDVAFAQTFVLTPLIFLGGVFYSAALLPQPYETLTHFNPIYYMINLVRYGFVGYTEVSIPLSLLALTAADRGPLPGQPAPLQQGYRPGYTTLRGGIERPLRHLTSSHSEMCLEGVPTPRGRPRDRRPDAPSRGRRAGPGSRPRR